MAQAKAHRVKYRNEVLRLFVHGLLHLVGYDDTNNRLKDAMLGKGDHYLAAIDV